MKALARKATIGSVDDLLAARGAVGFRYFRHEERFEVIAGTLRGRVAGKEFASDPGETVVVPRGAPHVWWNSGDNELHAREDHGNPSIAILLRSRKQPLRQA